MRSIHMVMALAIIAPQTGATQSAGPATAVAAQDTVQPAPKKKGGLFGKMKGLAKSKVVNTVAKAALCTAVPGGSMIASAVEAKKAKGVKEAAGAAANLAGGASGGCMPGMGLAGKAGAAANVAGVAGAGVPGVGLPGLPTTGLSSAALSAGQMNGMQGMTAASITPEQLKQMEEQYRKMGMKPDQIKAMEIQIQAMQQSTGGPTEATEAAAAPAALAPTPAIAVAAPAGLSNEHGRLTLHGLSWMPASAVIRPDAQASFSLAMRDVAAAIQGSSKRYSIQARVEEQGKKAQNRALSHQRAAAVMTGLVAEGIPAAQLKVAEGGSDKDTRIVIQETK
jgi:outer membrane protein OmpA-like peptidoglycan-associated protein